LSSGQVEVAPCPVLRLITELLKSIGLEILGCLIVWIGKYDMVYHLGDPAIVALVIGRLGFSVGQFRKKLCNPMGENCLTFMPKSLF
jgi:hypothetical protein